MVYSSLFKFQFMISEKVTFDYLCLMFVLFSFFVNFFYKGRIKSRHMRMQRKTRYTSMISISLSLLFPLLSFFYKTRDNN